MLGSRRSVFYPAYEERWLGQPTINSNALMKMRAHKCIRVNNVFYEPLENIYTRIWLFPITTNDSDIFVLQTIFKTADLQTPLTFA